MAKYDPDQITLRKMTDRITAKKFITSFYNDKVERGVEMFPVDSVSAYFLEGSPMDSDIFSDSIEFYLYKMQIQDYLKVKCSKC
uniref:Uncharacterized protein n=1 Tax=Rhizophagus irregularis (strain DAOM 181602 / DAOM 197198 / MUCL 43194) TaxID=747089 RepID=U9TIC4_RHIID